MTDTIQVDKDRYMWEQQQLNLLYSIVPYGGQDIATAAEWLDRAGMNYGDFGTWLEEYCADTGTSMAEADVAAGVLEYIAQETCPELSQYVYGNYMYSTFDVPEEKAGEILYAIPEEERGEAWEFLRDFTSAIDPKESDENETP